MIKKSVVLSIASLLSLISCTAMQNAVSSTASLFSSASDKNNQKIATLKLGQSKEETIAFMGVPEKREMRMIGETGIADIFFYRTEKLTSPKQSEFTKNSEAQALTPLIFEHDQLVGIGNGFYNDILGKERTTAKQNNKNINSINIGQKKEEFLSIMGQAERRETREIEGIIADVCFYRTENWESSNDDFEFNFFGLAKGKSASKDPYTPFVFENGKLIGWGQDFYKEMLKRETKQGVLVRTT